MTLNLYPKIEENEQRRLFEDRIEFKLWSAKQHLDKLINIEKHYGGIMGDNKIYAENEMDCYFAQLIGAKDALLMLINEKCGLNLQEKEVSLCSINIELKRIQRQNIINDLNKLNSNPKSWYWILNELRNRSIHRTMLNKNVHVHLFESLKANNTSSTVKNYLLLPPEYKVPINQETTEYMSDNVIEMRNLIEKIRKKL